MTLLGIFSFHGKRPPQYDGVVNIYSLNSYNFKGYYVIKCCTLFECIQIKGDRMFKRILAWIGIILILALFAFMTINVFKVAQQMPAAATAAKGSSGSRVNYVEVVIMAIAAVLIIARLKYDARQGKAEKNNTTKTKND